MRMHSRLLAAALLACFAAGLTRCGPSSPPSTSGKPVVVASIYPLASLATELVDGWAEVRTLLPPGASEHSTELTPEAMSRLSRADVLVIAGRGLDDWVADKAKSLGKPSLKVVRFADVVDTAATSPATAAHAHDDHDHDHAAHGGHDHSGPNPHLWLDPVLADRFIATLAEELKPVFPGREEPLRTRAQIVRMNLGLLTQEFAAKFSQIPSKRLVTFHNAFDPLAERFGLEVVAHLTEIELSPGGEVTPARLSEAIAQVKRHRLAVVYAEPQFPDSAMRAITRETGAEVLRLDPLGGPGVEGYATYYEMMKSNLETLMRGQTKRAGPQP